MGYTENLSLAIILIAVISLSGCLNSSSESSNPPVQDTLNESLAICSNMSQNDTRAGCYMEIAEGRKDDSICDQIQKDSDSSGKCHYFVAISSNNSVLCERISDNFTQALCVAMTSNSSNSTEWSLDIGQQLKKCASFKENISREICYNTLAEATRNLSICDRLLTNDSIRSCYKDVAGRTLDVFICEKLESEGERWLADGCYSEVGVGLHKLSLCDKISDHDVKIYCYKEIGIYYNDSSICDQILMGGTESGGIRTAKDECYREVGINTKDISICDKSKTFRGGCYMEVGAAIRNLTLCDYAGTMGDIWYRNECYMEIAIRSRNVSLCNMIINDTWVTQSICYDKVAALTQNISICDYSPNDVHNDECLYDVVALKENPNGYYVDENYRKEGYI